MIAEATATLSIGNDLDEATAAACCRELMSGATESSLTAAFLIALRDKGETQAELAGFVKAMREASVPVTVDCPTVDTAGTGGGISTFNVSTAAAFVIAGAGQAVAKHGNRSKSSLCGSADVLEALGARIEQTADQVQQCVEEIGFGFLFAPTFHPAMRHVGPVRSQIGGQTIFNLAGPLANPIRTEFQLVGANTTDKARLLATALSSLGVQRGYVVCGHGGCDEVSIDGPTDVFAVEGKTMATHKWSSEEFGVPATSAAIPEGRTPAENADRLARVLAGEPGPAREIVVVNAAAALLAANLVDSPAACAARARESIDSGAATKVLDQFVRLSNS